MMSGRKSKSYEEKCEEIGLETFVTLVARRERQDLLEAYKIIHDQGGEKLLVRNGIREGAACPP